MDRTNFLVLLISLMFMATGCSQNLLGSGNSSLPNSYLPGAPTELQELNPTWTPHYSNIVGYWRLDADFSHTIGLDFTPSGSGASIVRSALKAGYGSALFDGASYAATRTSSTYSFPNTTFTVTAWINVPVGCATGGEIIANGASGSNTGWSLELTATCLLNAFVKTSGGSNLKDTSTTPVLSDGNWHYVVGIFTTDTTVQANNIFFLYVDGVNRSSAMNYGGVNPYGDPGSTMSLSLGARGVPVTGATSFFTGNVDEVAIWNVALSATDIQTIFTAQSPTYSKNLQKQKSEKFFALFDHFRLP